MGSAEEAYDYDLVTIGAGSGGTRASRMAAQAYKAKVATVELPFGFVSNDWVGGAGGTCVIRGCVPKKLLVYGSAFSEEFKDAQGFGWQADEHPPFDWPLLLGKKAKEVQRLNGVYNKLLRDAGVELVEGRGKLVDHHTVEVELAGGATRRLTAKTILVATGGRATKAPVPGNEYAITSDEALDLPALPQGSIVIVGAGYISLEFAGIFKGVGKDVHLMFRKNLPLTGFDQECRQQVADNLQGRGIHLHPESKPTKIEKNADSSYTVHYEQGGKEGSMQAGLVMFGTGRAPNTKGLGLEALGVQLNDEGAVRVDEYSQTSVPNIYAIGDVTNRINLTPVAIMEAMAFTATVFGGKPTPPVHQKVASAVFVQPPLASVGLSEEQAKEQLQGDIDVYVSKFKPMKNTLSGRDEKTLMKIIVCAQSDQVLGVHMVGPDAPEIMQGFAVALKCNATKAQFDCTVGIHPSAAEELVTMRSKTRRIQGTGAFVLRH
ncbi:hypothetical protein WJX72_008342 [[Myrmecia] bisecta]|uniref:Glutathione reductase n=1 Tax=[Myrmecia] bisecta TaxID=41462 RepID=A0AAW1R8J8_9CHLO